MGLAAENGYYWRKNSEKENLKWVKLIEVDDLQWIKHVKEIMNGYKNKTGGSYIEEKESTISWNYKNTDMEFGRL